MAHKIKVPVKILDKRLERGWFSKKFFITIRPLDVLSPKESEVEIESDTYQDLQVGEEILLSFIDLDGHVYLYRC